MGALMLYYSSSITPNMGRHIFHLQQEDVFYSTTQAGRRIFLSGNDSANERLLQLSQWKANTLPMVFLFITAHLNFPFSP